VNELKFIKRTLKEDKNRNAELRDFFDLIVDGKSLFDQFVDAESDLASSFGFYTNTNLNIQIVDEFLKTQKSVLESERIMLFVCRECGDIGCGAITVEIEKKESSYVWKNFAWDNGYEEILKNDFIDFQVLEFNKAEYESELNTLKKNWLQHRV
jgi:hypothetical protein